MHYRLLRAFCAIALSGFCATAAFAAAGSNRLTDIRFWTSPTFTRLVFDLKSETAWETQQLEDASRLVFLLDGFDGTIPRELLSVNDGIVKKVRTLQSSGKIRILIELKKPSEHKIFILKKIGEKPPRLVIDILRPDLEQAARVQRQQTAQRKKQGDRIVVIDPGHGGEDPGAVSSSGLYEKNVVLSMCRQLADILNKKPGYRAYLTRNGDYFIPLGKRIEIAKEYGADLFLSVHVNAGFSSKAAGTSVYCLSFKGASTNLARIAEERENASDSIGGVPLEQQKSDLNLILCDLVQTHTINSSVQLAGLLLGEVGRFNRLYLSTPQEANFAVLRAPDIPSVLIETDFISSPDRETMLRSRDFQKRFVKTVGQTVESYLEGRPQRPVAPAGETLQARQAPADPATQSEKADRQPGIEKTNNPGRLAQEPVKKQKPQKSPGPVPAPPGYRVVKKSATAYALAPLDQDGSAAEEKTPARQPVQELRSPPLQVAKPEQTGRRLPEEKATAGSRAAQEPAEQASPPAGSFPVQAPPGYRVVKKNDTQYALEPIREAQAEPEKNTPAAPPVVKKTSRKTTALPATVVRHHIVKKNETLTSIARQYKMPLQELCRRNSLALGTKVAAGVKLTIVQQKPSSVH